ncbi:MAG TPA: hypothetical protein PKD85_09535, partial [Saprospiraceae bacterium]|nr:hypothetical protein [Saprospiraceae bacterium]
MGSGKLGAIAGNNNDIVFELSYDSNQNWKLKANYEGKNVLTQEFVFRDSWSFVKSGFFAIECIYTATRRDKYYFDNLVLDILTPDTIPPTLVSFNAVNERSIQVEFSEEVVAPNASNFSISPPINILSVTSTSSTNTRFELQLLSPLAEGSIYKLTVNNIKDIAGNIAPNFLVEIGLYKGPKIGDVIITELLFDPLSGGEDYIELFNKSEKIINLRLSKIGNPSRNQFITVPRDIFIKPKEHLCFAIDPVWVRNNFKPPTDANIISQALPLFNASDGAASIQNEAGEYLDSIFYNAKQHNKILNNVKGVSLERVINNEGSYENLWTSGVKATNYGTPGYLNANQNGNDQIINNYFSIANKTFSPNGDGIKDEVIINYSLPKPGFVAEVKVFGQDGHLIKTLYKGEFIASQGLLRWDGFNDKGE